MKKIILLLVIAFAFLSVQEVDAKGVIFYHSGPQFSKTHDLPADEKIDGKHVNFGVAYEQFGLFWMPVWNYGEVTYALITDDGNQAWSIDEKSLAYIKETYSIDVAEDPSIPFWTKVGLKPIIILLIAFAFIGNKKGDDEEGAEEEANGEEQQA